METMKYDFIIIGSGVAGITAAQYGARSNLKTLVLESNVYGGQVLNIFDLENYPGVYPSVNGFEFITTMKKQAESFGASFLTTSIDSIDKMKDNFVIKTSSGTFTSLTVLIATGATHRKLNIPGEDAFIGKGVSYCATCDGPFFKNKRIVVVGGGDAACDEANYLAGLSEYVTLIHRKSTLRAQKAVADRVLKNKNITVHFNTIVKEIQGKTKVESIILQDVISLETREMTVDGIFIFTGMEPQTELVKLLPRDSEGYIITNDKMETAISGMYCAGDVRSKSFRQVVTAASDGAIAAHSAEKYIKELNDEVYS